MKGGYVDDLPIAFCRQQLLSQKDDYFLEKMGEIFAYEICIGYNGKVWVKTEKQAETILIMSSLKKIV